MFNEVDRSYYIVKRVAKRALYTKCRLSEIMNANLLSGSRFAENNLLKKRLMTIGADAKSSATSPLVAGDNRGCASLNPNPTAERQLAQACRSRHVFRYCILKRHRTFEIYRFLNLESSVALLNQNNTAAHFVAVHEQASCKRLFRALWRASQLSGQSRYFITG